MVTQITLGVLADRLSRVQETLDKIQSDVETVNNQALNRRVTQLEENLKWIVRVVAGAFITSGVAAAVALAAR